MFSLEIFIVDLKADGIATLFLSQCFHKKRIKTSSWYFMGLYGNLVK